MQSKLTEKIENNIVCINSRVWYPSALMPQIHTWRTIVFIQSCILRQNPLSGWILMMRSLNWISAKSLMSVQHSWVFIFCQSSEGDIQIWPNSQWGCPILLVKNLKSSADRPVVISDWCLMGDEHNYFKSVSTSFS